MALSFDRRLLPSLYYYYKMLLIALSTQFLEYKTTGESTTGRKKMEESTGKRPNESVSTR